MCSTIPEPSTIGAGRALRFNGSKLVNTQIGHLDMSAIVSQMLANAPQLSGPLLWDVWLYRLEDHC